MLRFIPILLFLVASACGGSSTSPTGGTTTTPAPSTGGGTNNTGGGGGSSNPTTPPSPNYSTNGFTATEDDSFAVVAVLEMDPGNGNITRNFNSTVPDDLQVVYSPGSGLQIFSRARAFNGSFDSETQTFNGSGRTFGSGSPNFARVQTGEWTFAVDGLIDQNDGIYRHVIAVAGGETFARPNSGFGFYDGELGGVLEVFTNNSFNSLPIVAPGDVTVDFGNSQISALFELDPSRSNGMTGTIASAAGNLASNGSFNQPGNAGITRNGTFYFTQGTLAGSVAGPDSEEAYGIIRFGSTGSGSYTAVLLGSFVASDPDR